MNKNSNYSANNIFTTFIKIINPTGSQNHFCSLFFTTFATETITFWDRVYFFMLSPVSQKNKARVSQI